MTKIPFNDYMKKNDFREAVGSILNLSSDEDYELKRSVNAYDLTHSYNKFTENCTDPVEEGLESLGYNLGENMTPVSLGNSLIDNGLVRRFVFYERNPNNPKPSNGDNAPWTKK